MKKSRRRRFGLSPPPPQQKSIQNRSRDPSRGPPWPVLRVASSRFDENFHERPRNYGRYHSLGTCVGSNPGRPPHSKKASLKLPPPPLVCPFRPLLPGYLRCRPEGGQAQHGQLLTPLLARNGPRSPGWAAYDEKAPPPMREADGSYTQFQLHKQTGN